MQTIQKQFTVQTGSCPAYLTGQSGRLSARQARAAFARSLTQAAAALELRHPEWYHSLFDASLFEHEAAPLMERWVRDGAMPAAADLALCWIDSIGIRNPERRATRLQELEPIAGEFVRDLCRALGAAQNPR
jgi:hypothetical protein